MADMESAEGAAKDMTFRFKPVFSVVSLECGNEEDESAEQIKEKVLELLTEDAGISRAIEQVLNSEDVLMLKLVSKFCFMFRLLT